MGTTSVAGEVQDHIKVLKADASVIADDKQFWITLHKQINQMSEYAVSNGLKLPDEVTSSLIDLQEKKQLLDAHSMLSEMILPTSPQSLNYTLEIREEGSKQKWAFISPYPVIRELFVITTISGSAFILTGLSPDVNDINLSLGLLESSGIPLLLVSIFIASASALGACFSLLTQALNKVKSVSLSENDRPYFRANMMLGILSGIILSEVVTTSYSTVTEDLSLNRMILAILGGFSSELVYKILQGIMEKLKQLIGGN